MKIKEQLLPDNHHENQNNEQLLPYYNHENQNREQLLPGNHQENKSCSLNNTLGPLGVLDAFINIFLIAPLVVAIWRGIWGLMDLNQEHFPGAESYVFGVLLHLSFALIRSYLLERSRGARSGHGGSVIKWFWERFLARLYTITFIIACLMHWRGGWYLYDQTINAIVATLPAQIRSDTAVLLFVLVLMILTLGLLRSMKNLLASPYFLVVDSKEPTYVFVTRFKTDSLRDTKFYILDCIFSVVVVGSLVVFVWRGLWTLLDIYIYPGEHFNTNLASLILGYVLVALTFSLQSPARWACARLPPVPRLILADVYHLLSFFATVNLWRGVWGMLELYFLPEMPSLSNWLSHGVSLSILILLNCSNTVLVRGVYIDAEEPAGECVVFPCHYLRLFLHREKTKKRHKAALRAAAAAAAAARKSEDLSPLKPPSVLVQEKV